MKSIIIVFLLSLAIFANEDTSNESNNVVKTSELELFLFKMGFQSLLNDVDTTKNKVTLNEEELKKLNQKVSIIMDEVYKNKRVLKSDSSSVIVNSNNISSSEIEQLKKEIGLLKTQVKQLQVQKQKEEKLVSSIVISKKDKSIKIATVRPEEVYVRAAASANAEIIAILKQGEKVEIQKCSRFGWCKLKGEKKYIAKFLLDF